MLNQPRNTPARSAVNRVFPVAAGKLIHQGAMVVLDGGYAAPGSTKQNLTGAGVACKSADNTNGLDGAISVEVEAGCFRFDNSLTDPVTRADIGKPAYAVDDETVARTAGGNTRSAIGTIFDLDAEGVWVKF